jgi:transketolase
MRETLINTLLEFAEKRTDIYLLTADLGFSVLERFRDRFPDRFINAGVAEANMIGVAAGLAMSGKTVFVYSITPFSIFRPFEQIRIDICYQNLNVKIIGTGCGFDYGTSGTTHHAIEDIAVMRSLPNMKIISPADIFELKSGISLAIKERGPFYLRIPRTKNLNIHPSTFELSKWKGIIINRGKDIALISTGSMVSRCLEVAKILNEKGFNPTIASIPFLKPVDKELVTEIAETHRFLFTIEEHSIIGGLGSAAAEIISESGINTNFKRLGIPDRYPDLTGSSSYLLEKAGLSVDGIYSTIIQMVDSSNTLKG